MGVEASPRALIFGISGQDGVYLSQLLVSKGYSVWGTSRDPAASQFRTVAELKLLEQVRIIKICPEDPVQVHDAVAQIRPHEIYNLSGQSSVSRSFVMPLETFTSTAISTLNQVEAIKAVDPAIRYLSAGSGDCFGDTSSKEATEETPFKPRSPYAVAKTSAAMIVSTNRSNHGLFACTAFLFSHESPLRRENFVTKKIVMSALRLASGSSEKFSLGNLDVKRDWGWAQEYVEAMWLMLQGDQPRDFVISTGVGQLLEDFVDVIFREVGLNWRDHVKVDADLLRPADLVESVGNPAKAASELGWVPQIVGDEVPRRLIWELRKVVS